MFLMTWVGWAEALWEHSVVTSSTLTSLHPHFGTRMAVTLLGICMVTWNDVEP